MDILMMEKDLGYFCRALLEATNIWGILDLIYLAAMIGILERLL